MDIRRQQFTTARIESCQSAVFPSSLVTASTGGRSPFFVFLNCPRVSATAVLNYYIISLDFYTSFRKVVSSQLN
jgi:hypothetical protein